MDKWVKTCDEFKDILKNTFFEPHFPFIYLHFLRVEGRYNREETTVDLNDREMLPFERIWAYKKYIGDYVPHLKRELSICNSLLILLEENGECIIKGNKSKSILPPDIIINLLKERFKNREILTVYEIQNRKEELKIDSLLLPDEPTKDNILLVKGHIEESIRTNTQRGAPEKNYKLKDFLLVFSFIKNRMNDGKFSNNEYRTIFKLLDSIRYIDNEIKVHWEKADTYQPEIAYIKSLMREAEKK